MQKNSLITTYTFQGRSVEVCYRKIKGAKGMRIQISSGNRVVVTGNRSASFRMLERFFRLHQTWAEAKLEHFQKFPNTTIKLSPALYKKKKELARALVHEKLKHWNREYQFSWSRITIRNQSTRWGSCSSRGTLSFHAGIVDLPETLQDYLIVHELCHLKALNHGAAFWRLVQRTLPDARELDNRLKKYTDTSVV